MDVAIIGGGAAGFFSAIAVKENSPNASVVIFEKSQKVLAKVKISGGGRCNVTNAETSIAALCKAYPRGGKSLKKAFRTFSTGNTIEWFERRGVALVTQSDNCVFPVSQDSQTIIDCFLREAKRLKITIETGMGVRAITPIDKKLELHFTKANITPRQFDKVIVTTGGSPKREGLKWLEQLNHTIEGPVPSLFTFNIPNNSITKLMGVVVDNTLVSIQGTRLKSDGSLLITHWGMSGPAILKLSSYGARILSEKGYIFTIQVNWVNEQNHEVVANSLLSLSQEHSKKIIVNIRPYGLCSRLWTYLLEKAEVPANKKWGELGKKGINRLTNILTNDTFLVKGKSTFRDEFVTCGGVSLQDIDFNTMQSKVCKNLYFAGEVIDVDAITGGFNLQAAWTTAFIAGKLV
ncbi:MAG: NAD(P)/FAD-dependent oxidoreductase [Tenuifilaceae bacterium]|nr:NAD(P)/FAD-dependent oxidoreductase [Tenuifilaceae bacterium]